MNSKLSTLTAMVALLLLLTLTAFNGALGNFVGLTPPTLPTPIYIRADGTIEGASDALQRVGDVYVFLKDINETIEIQKDNIVLCGNGFKLIRPPPVEMEGFWSGGSGFYPSISLTLVENVTIQDIVFDDCHTCVKVKNSSRILLVDNEMYNCDTVVYMDSCKNSSIIGNNLHDNYGAGLFVLNSFNLLIAYNQITGTPQNHGLWVSISDSTLTKNTLTNNFIGLYVYGDNKNNHIYENNFINNTEGLCFMNTGTGRCQNNLLKNNYWNNTSHEIVNTDDSNPPDPSPLTAPLDISYEPYPYPIPTPPPTPPTGEQHPSSLLSATIILAIAASGAAVIGFVLVYFKKKRFR